MLSTVDLAAVIGTTGPTDQAAHRRRFLAAWPAELTIALGNEQPRQPAVARAPGHESSSPVAADRPSARPVSAIGSHANAVGDKLPCASTKARLAARWDRCSSSNESGLRCAAGSGGMHQPERPSAGGVRVPRFRRGSRSLVAPVLACSVACVEKHRGCSAFGTTALFSLGLSLGRSPPAARRGRSWPPSFLAGSALPQNASLARRRR
jgi:hypothetical protein